MWRVLAVVMVVGLAGFPVGAQQGDLDPEAPSSYFDAMPVHDDGEIFRQLLDRVQEECTRIDERCPAGTQLLRRLFQGSYRDHLPDFVVELAPGEEGGRLEARQPILMFDRRNTPYLMGVQQLGALVFSPKKVEMEARLTTIQESDVNPFAGLMGVFGVVAGDKAPTATRAQSTVPVVWRRLSGDDEEGLFLGTAQLPIKNEVVSRLTLLPKAEEPVAFQSITGHMSNSPSSYAAFSVGLGATFDTEDTALADKGDPLFNAYALAKFYLPGQRPRIDVAPGDHGVYRRSIGLVVGTNVTNDAFSEILLGVSFGHLIGKAGLIVAGNAIEGAAGSDREFKVLVGVDYTF